MPNHYQTNHSSAVGLHDILYALRRRRVLIVSLALCGLLLAAWMHFSRKPVYASDAKLLVRYVLERGAVDPYEARQNPGAAKADQVIQTEIEILTDEDRRTEAIALQLRTRDGIPLSLLPTLDPVESLTQQGLVELRDDRIFLTRAGKALADPIAAALV